MSTRLSQRRKKNRKKKGDPKIKPKRSQTRERLGQSTEFLTSIEKCSSEQRIDTAKTLECVVEEEVVVCSREWRILQAAGALIHRAPSFLADVGPVVTRTGVLPSMLIR